MNLDPFFHAKTIAVIGASREPGKVGHTILKQLVNKQFTLYPVNPRADTILGHKTYPNVNDIPGKVDLAVIATPAPTVPGILDECGTKGITHAIIISAGFNEIGNTALTTELNNALKRNTITCIGPNCLGVYDAHSQLDTFFLPRERLQRPQPGSISFVSQSGATGSAVMDLAALENYGFAKVISYGNAANVDESDLLEYLANDNQTKVICLYVEGIKDGKKFLTIARKCTKPIIAIKGGVTKAGSKAAKSHTGSLAGSADVYHGAFKQANIITAHTLEEVFEYTKIFDKEHAPANGKKVQVITNGGGYGILTADALVNHGLALAKPGTPITALRKHFPEAAIVGNPIDVLGDATNERYERAFSAALMDKNNDSIILVVLTQTPLTDEHLVDLIAEKVSKANKPVVAIITGSEYSQQLKRDFESKGVPCFTFPDNAVRALAAYTTYCAK